MKLLYCKNCGDLFNLQVHKIKSCSCGQTIGVYLNTLKAVYCGNNAVPLGIANRSLEAAMQHQPKDGQGEEFMAFVIPRQCDTYLEVDKMAIAYLRAMFPE